MAETSAPKAACIADRGIDELQMLAWCRIRPAIFQPEDQNADRNYHGQVAQYLVTAVHVEENDEATLYLELSGKLELTVGDIVSVVRFAELVDADVADQQPPRRLYEQVNGHMFHLLSEKPDAKGWSISQWTKVLNCSRETVHKTNAWQQIMKHRRGERTERLQAQNQTPAIMRYR